MWRPAVVLMALAGVAPVTRPPAAGDQCGIVALVTYVFDGDTVGMAGVGRVRLLGIDAPEIGGGFERPAPFAIEAKEMLQALVLKHWVRLDCDGARHDVYGRVLAYLFVDTRESVNEALVRAGMARVSARSRLQRLDELRQAEEDAQRDRRGMWGARPQTALLGPRSAAKLNGMPELPDIALYIHALTPRIVHQPIRGVRFANPFLLRSIDPPLGDVIGHRVQSMERLGKRLVIALEGELFLVFHLMIAGRFRWTVHGARVPGKVGLLAIDFDNGTLILTEAGTKRQASLHVVKGRKALAAHDPGGLDVFAIDLDTFHAALTRENHTLKRALTDPHLFSGIGNAYSDEILHAARMSPFKQTGTLSMDEARQLFDATRTTLSLWTARLQEQAGDQFPDKVTAFHEEMAVHGKFGKPCPDCGAPVQRIVYAANEANYCANCQTGGKLLADRALSRLLREDWPRSLDELERRRQP